MPNLFQVVYAASFAVTSVALFVLLEFAKTQLHARGIHVSDLILLGLDSKPTREPDPDAKMFSDSYGQLIALALALVTGALVFLKFSSGSACPCFARTGPGEC